MGAYLLQVGLLVESGGAVVVGGVVIAGRVVRSALADRLEPPLLPLPL